MTKKKTPTPLKKAAPKKKPLIGKNSQPEEMEWVADLKFENPPKILN